VLLPRARAPWSFRFAEGSASWANERCRPINAFGISWDRCSSRVNKIGQITLFKLVDFFLRKRGGTKPCSTSYTVARVIAKERQLSDSQATAKRPTATTAATLHGPATLLDVCAAFPSPVRLSVHVSCM
jgi:hypothetical protein